MMNYPLHNGYSGGADYGSAAEVAPRRRLKWSRLASRCVWLNGDLVPEEDTTARVLNPTLHYGPGALEVIRCYLTDRGPAIFRLEAHLQRFLQAARALGAGDLRYSLLDLRRAAHVTVQVNNLSTCTLRPILYFDVGSDPQMEGYHPTIAVVAGEGNELDSGWPGDQGIRAIVSSFDPVHPDVEMSPGNFDGQLASAITGRSLARRAGYDEAILLDPGGYVAGCAGQSLFLVHDGTVYTPPQAGALLDVARDTAITLLEDSGVRVVEDARLTKEHLYAADEVFLASVANEVVPVKQVDAHELNGGQVGPVTRSLQQLYARTVRGQGRRSRGWLEYVMLEPLF